MSSATGTNADTSPHIATSFASPSVVSSAPADSVMTAQARLAKLRDDITHLPLGLKIYPAGKFGPQNTAVVSCCGNTSVGYDFSFHVSGAKDFSQIGKETGNEVTFSRNMITIFTKNFEEIKKAAQYFSQPLTRPSKKGEHSPHDRNAARNMATLLGAYYVTASESRKSEDVWDFYGTENTIRDADPGLLTDHDLEVGQNSSSDLPFEKYHLRNRRDYKRFKGHLSKPDISLIVMPFSVRWTGGQEPFTLVKATADAASKEKERMEERRRLQKNARYHKKKEDQNPPGTSKRSLSRRDYSSGSEREERDSKRSRCASEAPPIQHTTVVNDDWFQQNMYDAPNLASHYETPFFSFPNQGQAELPAGAGCTQPPSYPQSQFVTPQSAHYTYQVQAPAMPLSQPNTNYPAAVHHLVWKDRNVTRSI